MEYIRSFRPGRYRRPLGAGLPKLPLVFWLTSIMWATVIALVIAVPAVLIENGLFRRMTPTRWWDFVLWGLAAVLGGLTLAARKLPGATSCRVEGRTVAGGGLTFVAVACPVCNKIVVALIGTSGALSYFGPLQPLLGLTGVGIMAFTFQTVFRSLSHRVERVVPDRPNQEERFGC